MAILTWIATQPSIRRAWLYGSRIKGCRSDPSKITPPDIDVAVELDEFDPQVSLLKQMRVLESFDDFVRLHRLDFPFGENSEQLDYVHIQLYEAGGSVQRYVQVGGELLYKRRDASV